MAEPAPEAPELLADGLLLRPYREADAPMLVSAVRESLGSVGRWLPWCHDGYGAEDAAQWIRHCDESWRSGEQFAFAVIDAGDGEFLGGAGLNQRNRSHNFMNLGYWVRSSRQRRRIAARATRTVAAFGFEKVGLNRIEIIAELDNLASRRVAETVGAHFEGIGRNRLVAFGRAVDAALYSLVPAAPVPQR